MTSSGMKRGLAVSAISALAMTGLPFMASTASAQPLSTTAGPDATSVVLAQPITSSVSNKADGTDSTIRLEALGGTGVASVKFEYAVGSSSTWNTITTVPRNDDGAFATEWSAAGLDGANLTIRATGLDANGVAVTGTAPTKAEAIDNSLATVNLTSGSGVGVFQQPNYGTGQNRQLVVVSGTSSTTSGTVNLKSYFGGTWNGTDTAAIGQAHPSDTTGVFTGMMDITGYPYGTGDQLLVGADNTSTSDTEAFGLYKQAITTVTATADRTTVPNGGSASITVTVDDQNGKPIAGAQVASSNGGSVKYTDVHGQATFSQAAGSAYYYADATATPGYQPELGDKQSNTITVQQYAPAPTSLKGVSVDGAAFDFDEYNAASDISVQAKDQQGNNIDTAGQTLQYYWMVTPFDGSAPVRYPASSATPNYTPQTAETNGDYVVPLPATTPGTYDLYAGLTADTLGNNAVGSSKVLSVKAGQASITFDKKSPQQAAAGTSTVVHGVLALEDGTPLPSRNVHLAYTRGAESNPSTGTADSGIVESDGTLGTAEDLTTGSDGVISATIKDPVKSPQPNEIGGSLAENATNTPGIGNSGASGTQGVDFLQSLAPATVTVDSSSSDTPGQVIDHQITVTTGDLDPTTTGTQSQPVTNADVTVTIDHGYFTDGTPASTPHTGDMVGSWKSLGKTITVHTDGKGHATVETAIGRDSGFDRNGTLTADITAKAGSVSGMGTEGWDTSNPLNGQVSVSFAPQRFQDSTMLPKAPTADRVAMYAKAKDQFGNPVGGAQINLSQDDPNGNLDGAQSSMWYGPSYVVSGFGSSPDFYASATDAGDQTVTGTWTTSKDLYDGSTPPADQGPSSNTVSSSKTINWYNVDYSKSTFTMTHSGAATQAVGSTVTDTYTAKDQFGNPLTDLYVKFFRTGPDNQQDGNGSFDGVTGRDGKIQYVFQGTQVGNATVTAVPREGGSSTGTVVSQGQRSSGVSFKYAINALLSLANTRAGNDIARVNAPAAAHGAQIRLYKVMANGSRKWVATKTANSNGDASFVVADANKSGFTKYQAYVTSTARTFADWTLAHSIR